MTTLAIIADKDCPDALSLAAHCRFVIGVDAERPACGKIKRLLDDVEADWIAIFEKGACKLRSAPGRRTEDCELLDLIDTANRLAKRKSMSRLMTRVAFGMDLLPEPVGPLAHMYPQDARLAA